LEYIKALAHEDTDDVARRFLRIFSTRLIAWVAEQDPSAAPEAVRLSLDLVEAEGLDLWVRIQALSGLFGIYNKHTDASVSGQPRGDVRKVKFSFSTPVFPDELTYVADEEYSASLLDHVRDDPRMKVMLQRLLEHENRYVRQHATAAVSVFPEPSLEASAAQKALNDPDYLVRQRSLASLVRLKRTGMGRSDVGAVLRQVVLHDQDEMGHVQKLALKHLPEAGPFDEETARFFSDAMGMEHLTPLSPELAEAAFGYLDSGDSPQARGTLAMLLAQRSDHERTIKVFVGRAAEHGMVELLPTFEALHAAAPDGSKAKRLLAEGIDNLSRSFEHVRRAEELKQARALLRSLTLTANARGLSWEQKLDLLDRISAAQATVRSLTDH
jgi:hypothetical protein